MASTKLSSNKATKLTTRPPMAPTRMEQMQRCPSWNARPLILLSRPSNCLRWIILERPCRKTPSRPWQNTSAISSSNWFNQSITKKQWRPKKLRRANRSKTSTGLPRPMCSSFLQWRSRSLGTKSSTQRAYQQQRWLEIKAKRRIAQLLEPQKLSSCKMSWTCAISIRNN